MTIIKINYDILGKESWYCKNKNKNKQERKMSLNLLFVYICQLIWFVSWIFCFFKYPVDDNFHMNSSLVHHRVQLVLSFVQWNVHDEAFLELGSILLNNLDQNLKKKNFLYLVFYKRMSKIILLIAIWTDRAALCIDNDHICKLCALRTPGILRRSSTTCE